MMAVVVPFPPARRIGQIRRTAAYMASASSAVAEAHLQREARRLVERLAGLQIPAATIEREVATYIAAVRQELMVVRLGDCDER